MSWPSTPPPPNCSAALIAKRMNLDYCLLFGEQYTYAYNLAEERFSADGTYACANSEATNEEDRRELEMGVDDAAQASGQHAVSFFGLFWTNRATPLVAQLIAPLPPPLSYPSREAILSATCPAATSSLSTMSLTMLRLLVRHRVADGAETPARFVLSDAASRSAASSAVKAAHLFTTVGKANRVYVLATHGIFSGDSCAQLNSAPIEKVLVTNSIPQEEHVKQCSKIKVRGRAAGPRGAKEIKRPGSGAGFV